MESAAQWAEKSMLDHWVNVHQLQRVFDDPYPLFPAGPLEQSFDCEQSTDAAIPTERAWTNGSSKSKTKDQLVQVRVFLLNTATLTSTNNKGQTVSQLYLSNRQSAASVCHQSSFFCSKREHLNVILFLWQTVTSPRSSFCVPRLLSQLGHMLKQASPRRNIGFLLSTNHNQCFSIFFLQSY